jgi:hypothetical protein
MKILIRGNKDKVVNCSTCPVCCTKFTFKDKELKNKKYFKNGYSYIICPVCKNEIFTWFKTLGN